LEADSKTQDFQSVYESSHVRRQLDDYRRQFRKLWYRPQAGLVVCRFGRIVGADIFGESRLFEALRRKILDSYALDRLHFAETRIYKSVTPQEVRDFVDRVVRAGIQTEGTPEIGRSITIGGPITGTALPVHGAVLHLNLVEPVAVRPLLR